MLPLEDFITSYKKFRTKAQNERNIRSTIPLRFAKMLKDLAKRDVDPEMFGRICENCVKHLPESSRNSARVVA